MKRKTLRFGAGLRVALGNQRVQAAEMVIKPGDAEGGPQNRHRGTDQSLLVVDGASIARFNGRSYPLKAGILLLLLSASHMCKSSRMPQHFIDT